MSDAIEADFEDIPFVDEDYDNMQYVDEDDGLLDLDYSDSFDDGLDDSLINPMLAIQGPRAAEYIYDENFSRKRMEWSDRLAWPVGSLFLGGFAAGATTGAFSGYRAKRSMMPRIKLNAVLNGFTNRGLRWGSALGGIAVIFFGIETTTRFLRDKEDTYNILIGTTLTPLVYQSASGPARALLWGLGGASIGAGIVAAREMNYFTILDQIF